MMTRFIHVLAYLTQRVKWGFLISENTSNHFKKKTFHIKAQYQENLMQIILIILVYFWNLNKPMDSSIEKG